MAFFIGFDKNRQNVEFRSHSKLSINFMSNCVLIEPKIEEFKLISAAFNWNYVMSKNLLFVFADFNFLDFCLAFKNEKICKKIYDYIATGKKKDTHVLENCSIDVSFIHPIFKEIADNPAFNSDLIEVIAQWHKMLDEEEKEKYSNRMKEFGIFEQVLNASEKFKSKIKKLKESRKRKYAEIETPTKNKLETRFCNKVIPSLQYRLFCAPGARTRTLIIYCTEERKHFHHFKTCFRSNIFKCVSCNRTAIIDFDENGEPCVKIESKKHSCKTSSVIPNNYHKVQIIRKSNYEIFDILSKRVLIIFDPVNRNLCYEFAANKQQSSIFYCRGCIHAKVDYALKPKAQIINNETKKEYVEVVNDHICEIRKARPEKYNPIYDYILKPNFEIQSVRRDGKDIQRLIVYDKNDNNKYYQYSYHFNKFRCCGCKMKNRFVSAILQKNSDDVEYIILSNAKHVCEPRTHIPKITLHPPDFELMKESNNGKSKIFVFGNNSRKVCYVFSEMKGHYECIGCLAVNARLKRVQNGNAYAAAVSGKLIEKNGKYLFEMLRTQNHICELRPYQPEKYQVLSKAYDFFFFQPINHKKILKLAIYSPKTRDLCFVFKFQKSTRLLTCIECQKMMKIVQLKAQKDKEGKEYFNHEIKEHICEPVKVSAISSKEFVILEEHRITTGPKLKNVDESKIVRMPNFELHPNKAGLPERKLIVLQSSDKTFYFEYYFCNKDKQFMCSKCHRKKLRVTAKLHKNGGETFIELGKNEHICAPAKMLTTSELPISFIESNITYFYQPPKSNRKRKPYEGKIVKTPNFELRPNTNKSGNADKKLIVFDPKDKSLCFEYYFIATRKSFECSKCKFKSVHVAAKLLKNDKDNEAYVVLGRNEHVCHPVKYQSL